MHKKHKELLKLLYKLNTPSLFELANITGRKPQNISKSLYRMQRAGYITIDRGGNGTGVRSRYKINPQIMKEILDTV